MKINEIHIERFGIWRDLHLTLDGPALTVIHGPNEAGKTTLLKFICGLLYGYDQSSDAQERTLQEATLRSGALKIEHNNECFEITRSSSPAGCELLAVIGTDEIHSDRERLFQLPEEAEAKIFHHVFAVGLQEIQKLSTLHDEEVAQHIYGLTLGPRGQKLLDLFDELDREKGRLLDPARPRGELLELLQEDEILCNEIELLKEQRDEHEQLCRERDSVEEVINELKSRKAGIHSQLRGHQFLEKVWPVWKQVQDLQNELDQLPDIAEFPQNGLERLEELEREIETAGCDRASWIASAERLHSEAGELHVDPVFQKHAESIESLVDHRGWLRELNLKRETLKNHAQAVIVRIEEAVRELGEGWSIERLKKIEILPADHYRLIGSARRYQSVQVRQKRLKNRYQIRSNLCQKQLLRLNEQRKLFPDLTIEQAVSETRQRLADLQVIAQLRPREAELEQRRLTLAEEIERCQFPIRIPNWITYTWGVLGLTGGLFAILGFATGLLASGTGGLVLSLSGLTGLGTAWGLKSHHRRESRNKLENLRGRLKETETQLQETRGQIAQLADGISLAELNNSEETPATECELFGQTVELLVELERCRELDLQIGRARRNLSEFRNRLRFCRQQVSEARQEWCRELNRIGLPETVEITEAFETWQKIAVAQDLLKERRAVTAECEAQQTIFEAFRERIIDLQKRIHADADGSQFHPEETEELTELLNRWEQQLADFRRNQSEHQRLLQEEDRHRNNAGEIEEQIARLTDEHAELLRQGGAENREEFEHRAKLAEDVCELQALLAVAQSELEAVALTEPDLAITHEDLLEFDASENSRCLEVLQSEQEDLETDTQEAFENLGRVKEQVQELEEDRSSCRLRFERTQLETRLKLKMQEWLGLLCAGRILEQMRTHHEKTKQPDALVSASRYLKRLTAGRYGNLWTPLGQRKLMVDDEQGRSLSVDQLSGGTREQLFLAVRFALVEDFRRRDIQLPMVLDDVIVNFDQSRAEAAADTLFDLAEQGQQILFFTCHPHLADMFAGKGAKRIHLPDHHRESAERRAG